MENFDELDALLDRYLDGVADEGDVRRLESLILADEAAADRAAQRSLASRQISELLTEAKLHEAMSEFAGGMTGLPRDEKTSAAKSRGVSRRLVAAVATAAAAGIAIFLLFRPDQAPPGERSPSASLQATDDAGQRVDAATVTQLAGVDWAPGATRYRLGESLADGSHIVFAKGLAKITFDCGAEVMLEGPCDFTVRDKMVGVLDRGRLAANVPRRAFSFAILSPTVDFVDLGTSFGVSVDDRGDAELHVFEGEVLYNSTAPADRRQNEASHVRAEEAVKFARAGGSTDIEADASEFSPLLEMRHAPSKQESLPAHAKLALWFKADSGVSTDDRGRVVGWQDILFDDNRTAEDATQVEEQAQPLLAPNALHGRAAVRFDGVADYLLTTPLETTDDQTVLLVCQYSPSAFDKSRRWGGQILNYDGPPGREASNTFAPGILQIGEPLLESQFQPTLVTAQVFAGFIGSAVVETGRVDAQAIGAGEPAVIAYRYDYGRGKADLSISGHSFGEERAFAPQALTSRKIIGRHAWKELYFDGDLAELLIFNKALSNKELNAVTQYLGHKFEIPLAAGAASDPGGAP